MSESTRVKWFLLGLHLFTAWDHLSWSQINTSFFYSPVVIKLSNNSYFKEWLQLVCSHWLLKGYSWNECKVISFLMNEHFWKVKPFSLDKLYARRLCIWLYVNLHWECVCACAYFSNELLHYSQLGNDSANWKLFLT